MKATYKIGQIRGIAVSVHWTFLLFLGWVILLNFFAGFHAEEIIWTILLLISVFFCILAHELGHALMARYFGVQATGIILLPIGGVANVQTFPRKPRQELLITLAGPMVNLTIALVLLLFLHPYKAYWDDTENIGVVNQGNFLFQLQVINMALALFNLIPAFPMDGGRILRSLLALRMNVVKATQISGIIGKLIAIGFVVWGLVSINPFLPIIGIFILLAARSEEYYLQINTMAQGLKLREVVMHDYPHLDGEETVRDALNILMNNHSRQFIIMEAGKPAGTVHRMQIIKSIAEMKYFLRIKQLMKDNLEFLDANLDVERVLGKLAANDQKIYPVMDHEQFAGVVNFQHLIEYLLIHTATSQEYHRIKSLAGIG
jgi:Zn-dependent protease/predicted transcriptional regulator